MKLGPYAIEQDYSQYVQSSSEIIFAVVGTATKGPIETPTVCTSPADLISKFGNLNTNCLGLYAAYYFLSHASKVWFVRAAAHTLESESQIIKLVAKESTVKISGKDSTNVLLEEALIFKAPSEGTFYDNYKVSIKYLKKLNEEGIEVDDPSSFDLIVLNSQGQILESHKNLSLESIDEDFESNYLIFERKSETLSQINAGTYTFSGGNDGIEGITEADYIRAGDLLSRDTIDMNLFAVPGVSNITVIAEMINLAEIRKDCLFLVDPPNHLNPNSVADWHNGTGAYSSNAKLNSSYAAAYYSWQKIYDPYNQAYVEVPPSVVVAPVIAESTNTTEIWYAPAGLKRGLVKGVVSPVYCPDTGDMEFLYSGDNNINSIINDPQAGLCVFGQKTLYRANSALNRVNVRMLLNYLKRAVVAACRYMTFEPNDRVTWNNFEDLIEPFLKGIKNRRGIYEYTIVKGSAIVTPNDIDNYRMPCKILIKPTKSAEEIPIYFTLTNSGADFNEVLANEGISQVTT